MCIKISLRFDYQLRSALEERMRLLKKRLQFRIDWRKEEEWDRCEIKNEIYNFHYGKWYAVGKKFRQSATFRQMPTYGVSAFRLVGSS